MAKKTDLEVVKENKDESLDKLKNIAKTFSSYMNNQYKEAVSYTPDIDTVAKVSVSKWVNMPVLGEAIGLPGLPIGNITHVFGKPNTGKTTILMEGIAACQKQGILPILILTEHKFDFGRLTNFMGADPEAMLVFHADNLEQAYGYMEKIIRDLIAGKIVLEDDKGKDQVIDMSNQDCYIFMDSIGNTMSESELEYEVEDHGKSMGKGAKAIKTLTKRLNSLLSKVRQKCGVLLLNQSYQSMPAYGPSVETPTGGDGVIYSCVLNIRLRRKGDLKMTVKGKDSIIGLETLIEVKKNHISHAMNIASVYTVASGLIPATDEALKEYKKHILKV
jgi:recombination protein RecA